MSNCKEIDNNNKNNKNNNNNNTVRSNNSRKSIGSVVCGPNFKNATIMKTRLSNQSDFRHCLATSLCISDKSVLRSLQRLWNQSKLYAAKSRFVSYARAEASCMAAGYEAQWSRDNHNDGKADKNQLM